MPLFVGHSYLNAALATDGSPYPVVIMSYGFGGDRRGNHTAKMEELASYGFVAVAIDHSDCEATVFPDGRLIHSGARYSELLNSSPQTQTYYFTNRLRDVQFVLDELTRMNHDDPILEGRMDLDRIGAMGHSFGGGTAAEVARIDPRVKVAVLFDPALSVYSPQVAKLVQLGVQKPFLGMYSTQVGGDQSLFNKATQDAFYMLINNTQHADFSDLGPYVDKANNSARRACAAMNACMVSFFKKYLKGQDDHLLDNPPGQYREVINFRKK